MVQLLSSIIAILASSTALVQALPATDRTSPPSDIDITNISYGGTGCPQGTASVYLSPDGSSFAVGLREFSAKLGTDDFTDTRKFCQLNLALKAPAGFQYSIATANFYGYANLAAGQKAKHTSTFYWSGYTDQTCVAIPLYGPAKYVYNLQGVAVSGGNLWSPCGSSAALNIKSELNIAGTGKGEITEVGTTGEISTIFGLVWRKC